MPAMNIPLHRREWLSLAAALLASPGARAADPGWTASWRCAEQPSVKGRPQRYENQTLRLILPLHLGGSALRLQLSNRYGTAPLRIASARVARHLQGARIDPDTDRPLSLPASIAPGETAWSEPVDLALTGPCELALSLQLDAPAEIGTVHLLAQQTSYVAPGAQAATAELAQAQRLEGKRGLAALLTEAQ
jgi:hypothetical protein